MNQALHFSSFGLHQFSSISQYGKSLMLGNAGESSLAVYPRCRKKSKSFYSLREPTLGAGLLPSVHLVSGSLADRYLHILSHLGVLSTN
jgi:hypothetical protein